MSVCSISILPTGKGTSISGTLAKCIKALERFSDLKHEITAMSTQLEGPTDRIFEAFKAMHAAAFSDGTARVYTVIALDERRDKDVTLAGKVASLRQKLKS